MSNSAAPADSVEKLAKGHADTEQSRMPVTILTGFLGSGKTTCLNSFLRSPLAANTAVLINEFGEIDIDGAVLSASLADGSKMVTLPNGCVCCAVQEDLVDALLVLANRSTDPVEKIGRCIIETTGLANPGAIISGAGHDPRLIATILIDQTITVCAADRLQDQLVRFEEVGRQLGIADRVIVTKTDRISDEENVKISEIIARLSPLAKVQIAVNGALDSGIFMRPPEADGAAIIEMAHAEHHHHHSAAIQSFSVHLTEDLDLGRFKDVMSFLIMRHAENLLRIKGVLKFKGEKMPRLINGVHDVFSSVLIPELKLHTNKSGSIVFIGIDLPEAIIRTDLEYCQAI